MYAQGSGDNRSEYTVYTLLLSWWGTDLQREQSKLFFDFNGCICPLPFVELRHEPSDSAQTDFYHLLEDVPFEGWCHQLSLLLP